MKRRNRNRRKREEVMIKKILSKEYIPRRLLFLVQGAYLPGTGQISLLMLLIREGGRKCKKGSSSETGEDSGCSRGLVSGGEAVTKFSLNLLFKGLPIKTHYLLLSSFPRLFFSPPTHESYTITHFFPKTIYQRAGKEKKKKKK